MLKPSIPVISYRIHSLAIALSLMCFLLSTSCAHAERIKQRGVAIPDAPDMFVNGTTRLDRNESGADLTLPLNANETWPLLNRVLAGLGIKPKQQDDQRQLLLTGWILWVWNPRLETGRSKPPLKALSRTYERHRFEFSVSPAATDTEAVIHISDSARQREVDITPDSAYTWLQWQDAELQADAAWSFMRRLQGNFESALSSRVLPSTVAAPRIIEPVQPSRPTRETTAATPTAPVSIPAPAVIVAPAGTLSTPAPVPVPVPPQPTVKQSSNKPDQSKPPAIEPRQAVAEQPAEIADTPSLPEPSPTAELQPVAQTPTRPAKLQPTPPSAAPLAVQGGLLVDSGLDATWQALLAELDALGIKLQSSDQPQHMLTTQWIDAMYNKKNQLFTLESKAEQRWAFNLWGKGHERHRFQLILIPVDGGARTMVYAYHTGFQEETDRTPDSSQTQLYWKDHKTEPAIAMAFLRRLQLVVGQ